MREVCILAIAGECDNAFEWAAHEPEALRVGVPQQIIDAIRIRAATADMDAPFGTMVELIREAFTARSVGATTYDAALALLAYGFSSIWCRWPGSMPAPPRYSPCAQPVSASLNEGSPLLSPAGGVCSGVEVVEWVLDLWAWPELLSKVTHGNAHTLLPRLVINTAQ